MISAFWGWTWVLVELAFEFSVEEFSSAVGPAAELVFEGAVGGDHVDAPRIQRGKDASEFAVDGRNFLGVTESFSVGWVADDDAVVLVAAEVADFLFTELDITFDSGFAGTAFGEPNGGGVMVEAEYSLSESGLSEVTGFGASVFPDAAVEPAPILGGEGASHTGGHVSSDECGFDGDGAAAAEWINKESFAVPVAELNESGGHGFAEWCGADEGPIAAFVESIAGGIEGDGGDIAEE